MLLLSQMHELQAYRILGMSLSKKQLKLELRLYLFHERLQFYPLLSQVDLIATSISISDSSL